MWNSGRATERVHLLLPGTQGEDFSSCEHRLGLVGLSVRETLEKSFALDKPRDQAHNHKTNWTTWINSLCSTSRLMFTGIWGEETDSLRNLSSTEWKERHRLGLGSEEGAGRKREKSTDKGQWGRNWESSAPWWPLSVKIPSTRKFSWAGEMLQPVSALATKPDDLSLNHVSRRTESNQHAQVVLWPLNATHTQHTYNK